MKVLRYISVIIFFSPALSYSSIIDVKVWENQNIHNLNESQVKIINGSDTACRFQVIGQRRYISPLVVTGRSYTFKDVIPDSEHKVYISTSNKNNEFNYDDYIGLFVDKRRHMILSTGLCLYHKSKFYLQVPVSGLYSWDDMATNVAQVTSGTFIRLSKNNVLIGLKHGQICYFLHSLVMRYVA